MSDEDPDDPGAREMLWSTPGTWFQEQERKAGLPAEWPELPHKHEYYS